jgi:hypothetical protein
VLRARLRAAPVPVLPLVRLVLALPLVRLLQLVLLESMSWT